MDSEWTWTAAAVTAPSVLKAGSVGVDRDQPSLASLLYIHRLDLGNFDRSGYLIRLTGQDRIYLQQKSAASSWHRYEVTGRAKKEGDIWVIPVKTEVGSPVGTEPADKAPLLVEIR